MSDSPAPPPPPASDITSSSPPTPKARFSKLSPGIPKRFTESPKGRMINNSQFPRKGSKAPTPNRNRSPAREDSVSKGKMPFRSLAVKKDPTPDNRRSPGVPKPTTPTSSNGKSMFSRTSVRPRLSKPVARSSSAPATRTKSSPKTKNLENKSTIGVPKSVGAKGKSDEKESQYSSSKQGFSGVEDSLESGRRHTSSLKIDLGAVFNTDGGNEHYRGAFESQPSSEASLSLLMHCQPSRKDYEVDDYEDDESGVTSQANNLDSQRVFSPSDSRTRSSAEILSLLNNIPTSPSLNKPTVEEPLTPVLPPSANVVVQQLPEAYLQHLSCVIPGVYIGDIEAAVSADMLSAAGITHLVDLSNSFVDENTELAKSRPSKNVNYEVSQTEGGWIVELPMLTSKLIVRVDDVDGAPLAEHFDSINKYMIAAIGGGGSVLVHCFRGKSRSATAVVQFLMQVEKMNLKEAMSRTRKARPCIDINVTFRKALMELERILRPDEEPSIKLRLTSRKPVLSSANRMRMRSKSAPKRVGATSLRKKKENPGKESDVSLKQPIIEETTSEASVNQPAPGAAEEEPSN